MAITHSRRKDEWALAGVLWLLLSLIVTVQVALGGLFAGIEVRVPRAFAWGLAVNLYWAALVPAIAWLGRRLPVTRDRWLRSVSGHSATAIFNAAVHSCLAALLVVLIRPFPSAELADWQFFAREYFGAALELEFVMYWAVLGIAMTVESRREAVERERRSARLESQLAEARLRALKAQLQPHFFFNALNTVSMLIRNRDHALAVDMISDIGDLVRRAMDAESRSFTPLASEIDFTSRYLDVERVRFEGRISVSVDVPESLSDVPVPTMIVQPLVENAIRHGVAHRGAGAIVEVKAAQEGEELEITVTDNGPGPTPEWTEGIGLSNTRKRLATHYGDRAEFSLARLHRELTVARILLPLEHPEGVPLSHGRTA